MKSVCLLSFLAAFILLNSCSHSALGKKLSGSDSLVINFYAAGSDSIVKTVQATDLNAIHKMRDFMDTKTAEKFQCGYDGSLIFFSKGRPLLPVVFKYKDPGCRHFSFALDGKLVNTKMNNEASDFLESLEKGSLYY